MAISGFSVNISWSQFRQLTGRPSGEEEDAQIHPEISFENFQLAKKGKAIIIKEVDVKVDLVAADCWVVSSQMTDDLLKHEQGHYDIIALNARELYKSLLSVSASSTQQLQEKVNGLQEKAQKKVKRVDERYDDQTDHSRKTAVQQTWNQRIAAEKAKPDGSLDNLP